MNLNEDMLNIEQEASNGRSRHERKTMVVGVV